MTWLPDWIAMGWRVGVWLAIMYLVGKMAWRAVQGDHPMLAYGRAALVIFMVQDLLVNAERFGDPLTYEGVPITTIAVFFTWRAMLVAERNEPGAE